MTTLSLQVKRTKINVLQSKWKSRLASKAKLSKREKQMFEKDSLYFKELIRGVSEFEDDICETCQRPFETCIC